MKNVLKIAPLKEKYYLSLRDWKIRTKYRQFYKIHHELVILTIQIVSVTILLIFFARRVIVFYAFSRAVTQNIVRTSFFKTNFFLVIFTQIII